MVFEVTDFQNVSKYGTVDISTLPFQHIYKRDSCIFVSFGETEVHSYFLKNLKGYTWIFKHLSRVNNFVSIELFAN